MPVCSLQEVDEEYPQGLLSLAYLPLLDSAVALQVLTEPPDLVPQGFVRSLSHQESAHPAHAMRRRPLSYQLRPEQELAELLERRFELTHRPPGPTSSATCVPLPRSHGESWNSRKLSGRRHQCPSLGFASASPTGTAG